MQTVTSAFYRAGARIASSLGLDRTRAVQYAGNLVINLFKSDYVEVQGRKMFLGSRDSLRLSIHGIYEPYETEILKGMINRGETVLDIGANIGYYTLIFADLVGEEGLVFAFEPDPTNLSLLRKNVAINGHLNVNSQQKAVYSRSCRLDLFLNPENESDHRIYETERNRKAVSIDAVSLDEYLMDEERGIDLIKMDIQGAEMSALEGMGAVLARNRDIKLVTEFLPLAMSEFGTEPADYLGLLVEHGFTLFDIDERRKRLVETDESTLLKKYTTGNGECTNLLCLRK